MKTHIYFPVTITVAYTVEIPDGMSVDEVAHGLKNSESFYAEHLHPDLTGADWYFDDLDWDGWCDELDFTAEQVTEYLK